MFVSNRVANTISKIDYKNFTVVDQYPGPTGPDCMDITADGKTILFFQSAGKFKVRFATLGFSEHATLDEGEMWPTSYALNKIDKTAQAQIVELIKRATGRL